MNSQIHKLSLLQNSHSFLTEAAEKAIVARKEISQWPFAILNAVQAMELSLKELLRRQHPVLIYEDADKPRHTVSITKALVRLENPMIANIALPVDEKRKIQTAIDLRNQITHFEFELTDESAMARFSEVFAFVVYFQGRYLQLEVEEILPAGLLSGVIEIQKCFSELKVKAIQRIHDEGISLEWVWSCPQCGEDTFVVEDDRNICFLCRETEEVCACPQCGTFRFRFELHDFSLDLDWDIDEGVGRILDNYAYSEYQACPECIGKVREDIEKKRAASYYRFMEEDEWHRRNHEPPRV